MTKTRRDAIGRNNGKMQHISHRTNNLMLPNITRIKKERAIGSLFFDPLTKLLHGNATATD